MWCVYELAMFLKVRPRGNVVFIYHWQCIVFLIIFVFESLAYVIPNLLLAGLDVDVAISFRAGQFWAQYVYYSIKLLQIVAMYVAGRLYFKNERAVRNLQKSFDVRMAECGVPDDVPILLDSIKEKLVGLKEYLEGEYDQAEVGKKVDDLVSSIKSGLGGK